MEESEVTIIRPPEASREVDDRNGDSVFIDEASAIHDDSASSVIGPSASTSVGDSSVNLLSDTISTVDVDGDYETEFGEDVDMTGSDVSCSHQSSKSARTMPLPLQRIIIYLIEKTDPNFLIPRFNIEGEIQGSDRANLQEIAKATVKDVLNNSGYRTEIENFSGNTSTIRRDGEQFVHPAPSVMTGTSLHFEFQISRQKYQYRSTFGDWLRVDLSVGAVVPDGVDSRTPLLFEHLEWKPISSMCGQECVELTKAATDVIRSAVTRLAGQIVSMLTEQRPDATSYRYKLILNNLTREERTGIEHALVQLPEYLSHRSEYSGTVRSEWEYVSHINASYLCHRLLGIVKFEGLDESVSVMIR